MLTDAFQSASRRPTGCIPPSPRWPLPDGFDAFRPAKSLLMTAEEAQAARDPALAEWQAALVTR
jgi:thiamine transport system substrate-binding protein